MAPEINQKQESFLLLLQLAQPLLMISIAAKSMNIIDHSYYYEGYTTFKQRSCNKIIPFLFYF